MKFSVHKSSHGTVNVRWADGPTTAEVQHIAGKLQARPLQRMEDIYGDERPAWCEVFGGAEYVFCGREESGALIAQAIEQVCTEYAGNLNGMGPRPSRPSRWAPLHALRAGA